MDRRVTLFALILAIQVNPFNSFQSHDKATVQEKAFALTDQFLEFQIDKFAQEFSARFQLSEEDASKDLVFTELTLFSPSGETEFDIWQYNSKEDSYTMNVNVPAPGKWTLRIQTAAERFNLLVYKPLPDTNKFKVRFASTIIKSYSHRRYVNRRWVKYYKYTAGKIEKLPFEGDQHILVKPPSGERVENILIKNENTGEERLLVKDISVKNWNDFYCSQKYNFKFKSGYSIEINYIKSRREVKSSEQILYLADQYSFRPYSKLSLNTLDKSTFKVLKLKYGTVFTLAVKIGIGVAILVVLLICVAVALCCCRFSG